MVDVVTTAYTIIFIGILLLVGIVVFATVADPMSDQYFARETIIAAGCSDDNATTQFTLCSGTANRLPIENGTRAAPVVLNCSTDLVTCQTLTDATDYNFTNAGVFQIITDTNGDKYNGTILASYWQDIWSDRTDNAQQSITSTVYGGFDLATVMVIVMAAVAIVGTIFLIGRRGE